VAGGLGGDEIDGVRCVGSGHSAPSTANAPPPRLRPPRGPANPAMGRSRIGPGAGKSVPRIRWLDDASGGRDGSSDSSRSPAADKAMGTQTMAAPEGRFRNRFNDAAIQGDLSLPETSGLNRRGGSEQVVESGAAGLGTRGFARWPERDGMGRRSGGTVSADTIGFGTGRPSPGRRPRSRRRVRTSGLDRARLRVRGCPHSAPLIADGGSPTGDS